MYKAKYKTIGILGGMGPEATIQLFNYIVKHTQAKHDQEHLPILINNFPQIPDRTQALLYGGENPLPYLIKASQVLVDAGADFIIIPCNTSHAFYYELQKKIRIPIINMIEETTNYIKTYYPYIKRVGLLATTGTIKMSLYQKSLTKKGIEVIVPSELYQEKYVMNAIYGKMGIKAGFINKYSRQALLKVIQKFVKNNVQAVIMGCTEIPLVLNTKDATNTNIIFINPTEILAYKAIRIAKSSNIAVKEKVHQKAFKQMILEYEAN